MNKSSDTPTAKMHKVVFNRQEIMLHQASQLIALTGINLQPPLPDDSQNTIVYDDKLKLLLGRPFQLAKVAYRIGIALEPFELVLLDNDFGIKERLDLNDCKKNNAMDHWASWLKNLGFVKPVSLELNYQLPTTSLYSSNTYEALDDDFVINWHNIRSLSNSTLANLNNIAGLESEINIWPHHFDTGVYYPLNEAHGQVVASVGAGLAIADSMINEPYFYIYGYKKDNEINFENTPELNRGNWLTDGWKGAVLPVSELPDTKAASQIDIFFKQSYNFFVSQL